MPGKRAFPWILTAGVAAALILLPTIPESHETQRVVVTNFPSLQPISGEVTIKEPVRLAEAVRFTEILVPPVEPLDTTRLIKAGTLETKGFPNVVLSLQGQVKGDVQRIGEVGAFLLPREDAVAEAFNEVGAIQFPLEVVAGGVSRDTPYFSSSQPRHVVGFERYDLLLYNTTDKAVTVNLYAYLTN